MEGEMMAGWSGVLGGRGVVGLDERTVALPGVAAAERAGVATAGAGTGGLREGTDDGDSANADGGGRGSEGGASLDGASFSCICWSSFS